MDDDNVFFQHTKLLIQKLVKHGKPYSLNVYPSEKHGIRTVKAFEHYEKNLLYIYEKNLR